jgi:flagellar assembly factor FliW
MKISRTAPSAVEKREKLALHLPFGLIGLRHLTHFELEPAAESMPFQVLRAIGNEIYEFVVVDPSTLLDGYSCVLRDEDVDSLRIGRVEDAMILNIVAIHSHDPQYVTVNLVGPIVVNRSTLIGQQVILHNSAEFSTDHVIVDQRPSEADSQSAVAGRATAQPSA